jgi:hypothetical protein
MEKGCFKLVLFNELKQNKILNRKCQVSIIQHPDRVLWQGNFQNKMSFLSDARVVVLPIAEAPCMVAPRATDMLSSGHTLDLT